MENDELIGGVSGFLGLYFVPTSAKAMTRYSKITQEKLEVKDDKKMDEESKMLYSEDVKMKKSENMKKDEEKF